jgi:molecular chaperone DnaK
MGAAVQGGLISGVEVGAVLVDITPHTLGIEALGTLHGLPSVHTFVPIIERNTALPASRTEMFSTVSDHQKAADIRVFQGENADTRYNTLVGEVLIEGLARVDAGNQIVVRLDLDLNGILKVTATERLTGLAQRVTIDNAIERFRSRQRTSAVDRLEAIFQTSEGEPASSSEPAAELPAVSLPAPSLGPAEDGMTPEQRQAVQDAEALMVKAERVLKGAKRRRFGGAEIPGQRPPRSRIPAVGRRDSPDLGRGRGPVVLHGRPVT